MEETLRVLVAIGLGLLLVMLRLDAERFGVAEYLDVDVGGPFATLRRRLAWYVIGLAIIAAILIIYQGNEARLGLSLGGGGAVLAGLGYAAIGTAQAAAVAFLRYRRLRLPFVGSYPWGLVNAIGTAFIDEATFRGIILGFLLLAGLDGGVAVVVQGLAYALATRTGAGGRDLYLLAVSLGIGLLGGWLTLATGGIGAAFLGHAATRFAVFAFLGPDEVESDAGSDTGRDDDEMAPAGWTVIEARGSGARDQ